MGVRSESGAAQIASALRSAISELAGCDVRDVKVSVKAPALASHAGTFHVELRYDEPESGGNVSQEAAAPVLDAETDASTHAELTDAGADAGVMEITQEDLDQEADAAADFLEGLLDAFDLPGDLKIRVLEDRSEVEIADVGSGALIGRRGQTLDSIQELVRCALQRQFQRRSRVQIDAEGYRARRLEKLLEKAEDTIEEVLETRESIRLEPMDVFERKAVHEVVAKSAGVVSRSQGREPGRRVIIEPDDTDA